MGGGLLDLSFKYGSPWYMVEKNLRKLTEKRALSARALLFFGGCWEYKLEQTGHLPLFGF